jgi:hypothetical protein
MQVIICVDDVDSSSEKVSYCQTQTCVYYTNNGFSRKFYMEQKDKLHATFLYPTWRWFL